MHLTYSCGGPRETVLVHLHSQFCCRRYLRATFWYLAAPLWIDRVVNEALAHGEEVMIVAQGSFHYVDAVHRGKGTPRVVALPGGGVEVQLSGFELTNGPYLELWLSYHPDPARSADVTAGKSLSHGCLKAISTIKAIQSHLAPISDSTALLWSGANSSVCCFPPLRLAAPTVDRPDTV